MAESVSTGGVMRFTYEKGREMSLSEREKREIREAYERARERKRREEKRRMTMWIIALIVILILVGYILLR